MEKKCKPIKTGVMQINTTENGLPIYINMHTKQRWDYIETDDGKIELRYKIISLTMYKYEFERFFEVIE